MQERQRFQALSYQAQPVDLFQRLLPFSFTKSDRYNCSSQRKSAVGSYRAQAAFSGTFTRYIWDILDFSDTWKYLDSITRKGEGRTLHELLAWYQKHRESMPVVLQPELPMAIDVFRCEDGHPQEPSLSESVLQAVKADQLWIADRNMCTHTNLIWSCIE